MLNWHEVVNDWFDGPLRVTYCPLCRSGIASRRTVHDEPATFGVSEYLWRGNLVMYDDSSGSLWSQIKAAAIRGPLVGTELELVPVTITAWGRWRREHPETQVLLPPPRSDTVNGRDAARNCNVNPYGRYETSDEVPGEFDLESGLHPKILVLGDANGSRSTAYPLDVVSEAGVINDLVGDLPVVVALTAAGELVASVRRVDSGPIRFEVADDEHLRAGGSRWRTGTGVAFDGPLEGDQLRPATRRPPMFWFAWQRFHPDGRVYEA